MSANESGSALLLTLIIILMLSFLGLFIAFSANTGIKISDNYETEVQATYAALAGLNHARVLIRGLALDDLLKGPDGAYNSSSVYIAQARKFEFRNPLSMAALYGLDLFNVVLSGVSDDGILSTGFCDGAQGTVLIPVEGIGFFAENPYGAGQIVTSRYFVKATDNNGEASEILGDPGDSPFTDGDGIIIVRSVGLSRTFSEVAGLTTRLNSVAVFEARFKRLSTFDAGPAVVVLGSDLDASFDGTYEISGETFPGVGTIDTDMSDASLPDQILAAAAGTAGRITGAGRAVPSIQDISVDIFSNRDKSPLMNPGFLGEFVYARAPKFADFYFDGDQNWAAGTAPYTGSYDVARRWNATGQDPKITVINGNLRVSGDYSGAGLLVVTGALSYSGQFTFNGLVLVIGSGEITADASGEGIQGGLIVANLIKRNGSAVFGTPTLSISGNSRVSANRDAVKMAISLIPISQVGFREVAGSDP